jgi:hypothetical protein
MKQRSSNFFSDTCQISIEDTRELADDVMTCMFKDGMIELMKDAFPAGWLGAWNGSAKGYDVQKAQRVLHGSSINISKTLSENRVSFL